MFNARSTGRRHEINKQLLKHHTDNIQAIWNKKYLVDRENLQSVHANFWVEELQFTVTSINNDLNAINYKQQQTLDIPQ